MRISDWSSDVCSSDLKSLALGHRAELLAQAARLAGKDQRREVGELLFHALQHGLVGIVGDLPDRLAAPAIGRPGGGHGGPLPPKNSSRIAVVRASAPFFHRKSRPGCPGKCRLTLESRGFSEESRRGREPVGCRPYSSSRYSRVETTRRVLWISLPSWTPGMSSRARIWNTPWLARRMAPTRLPESAANRSEEHTSELQSLMRISYAVF